MTSPLKDPDAFKAKVYEYLEVKPWRTPEQAVATICDGIRYTWGFPIADYTAGIAEIVAKTRQNGYCLERLANFWLSPDFTGVTSVWRTPEGQLFEQQFHIAESLHARDFTFQMYERMRHPQACDQERAEIRALVREVIAAVPVPPGAVGIPAQAVRLPAPTPTTSAVTQVSRYVITDLPAEPGDLSSRGLVRRTVSEAGEHDEAFCRDERAGEMRWKPTSLLYSAERGDLAHQFTAVDEATAADIAGQLTQAYGGPTGRPSCTPRA